MAEEESKEAEKLGTLLAQVKENKQAIVDDASLKQSLTQELSGKAKMATDLTLEKQQFLQRHKIKDHQQDLLAQVKLATNQTVVSLPRKRDREESAEEEPLLGKSGKKEGKHGKADKGNKRHKDK